eukprot:CAMPEP_0197024842 /NCGR_PEP_ID=MMETSP1384-20130603/5325_1 /TAXON_ID=29189 /ORGANISM="Ammonia sp." /LENGTH=135 /DNA_ID=CAMNT_0042453299 /DNA_START=184 /DNA_END=591 /DNA_ORIENTATION=-
MAGLAKYYQLYSKYHAICNFVVIYIQEAHAVDEWKDDENKVELLQHQSMQDKIKACEQLIEIWKAEVEGVDKAIDEGKLKIVCDEFDGRVEQAFNAYPERLYILDKDNKVALKGGYGPYYFDVDDVEQFLKEKRE